MVVAVFIIQNVCPILVLQAASTVVIQVTSLTLHPGASILDDPNVKQVFVAYKFLDCDPAELETPTSLPKPAPYRSISFNFNKGKIKVQISLPRTLVVIQKQFARMHSFPSSAFGSTHAHRTMASIILEATVTLKVDVCKIVIKRGLTLTCLLF